MKSIRIFFMIALMLAPSQLFACATCLGKSDSALASGMNWGIFTLMAVIVTVLGTIASFFIFIIRRESALAKIEASQNLSESKV